MSETTDKLEWEWVEEPAAELMRVIFDYKPLTGDDVRRLREGLASEPVLTVRLAEALARLNPWLDEAGVRRAVSTVTRIAAVDLMEANERGHTALSYGVTAPYTDASGRRQDRTVRFFDFDDPAANVFEFARQVSIRGPRQDIIPDIIVYVNGLPLAVIECKSPALADPMGEAIRQFRRYESRDEFAGLGAPRLFETAQVSIALARDAARYGTTLTPARQWAEWKDPYRSRSAGDSPGRSGGSRTPPRPHNFRQPFLAVGRRGRKRQLGARQAPPLADETSPQGLCGSARPPRREERQPARRV